jgi:hypothetical protein
LLKVFLGDLYIFAAARALELDARAGDFFIGDTKELVAAATPGFHAAWPPECMTNPNFCYLSSQ